MYSISLLVCNFMLFLLHLKLGISWCLGMAYRCLFMLRRLVVCWMGLSNGFRTGLGFNLRSCLVFHYRWILRLHFKHGVLLVMFFRFLNSSFMCSWLEMFFNNCRLVVGFNMLLDFCGSLRGHFLHDYCCVFGVMILLMDWLLMVIAMVKMFYGL